MRITHVNPAGATAGLPAYLAASSYTPPRRYDPRLNVYGANAAGLRKIRAALGRAAVPAGGQAKVVIVGDSETDDFDGAYDFLTMWPQVFRDTLGLPSGGPGFIRCGRGGGSSDPHLQFFDTWTFTPADASTSVSGAAVNFLTIDACNGAAIYYRNNSGPFTYTVYAPDFATVIAGPTTVTPPGGAGVGVANTPALPTGEYLISVATTTATATKLVGFRATMTNGLIVDNFAVHGSTAAGSGTYSWADATATNIGPTLLPIAEALNPDLLIVALGVNDIDNAHTAAATTTAIQAIITGFTNTPDVLLIAQYEPGTITDAAWKQYVTALWQLADTLGCALLDLTDRSGGYTVANSNGLMAVDTIHPTAPGQRDWGRAVAEIVGGSGAPSRLFRSPALTTFSAALTTSPVTVRSLEVTHPPTPYPVRVRLAGSAILVISGDASCAGAAYTAYVAVNDGTNNKALLQFSGVFAANSAVLTFPIPLDAVIDDGLSVETLFTVKAWLGATTHITTASTYVLCGDGAGGAFGYGPAEMQAQILR